MRAARSAKGRAPPQAWTAAAQRSRRWWDRRQPTPKRAAPWASSRRTGTPRTRWGWVTAPRCTCSTEPGSGRPRRRRTARRSDPSTSNPRAAFPGRRSAPGFHRHPGCLEVQQVRSARDSLPYRRRPRQRSADPMAPDQQAPTVPGMRSSTPPPPRRPAGWRLPALDAPAGTRQRPPRPGHPRGPAPGRPVNPPARQRRPPR